MPVKESPKITVVKTVAEEDRVGEEGPQQTDHRPVMPFLLYWDSLLNKEVRK